MENIINETKDYTQFKIIDENRCIDRNHVNKLKDSISEFGYLASNPILVNGNKEIIDGQHRYVACKEMGLPIYYVVEDGNPSKIIIAINTTQRAWKIDDYINYWSEKGYGSYRLLSSLIRDMGVSSTIALTILGHSYGGKVTEYIRKGMFKTDMTAILDAKVKFKYIQTILGLSKLGRPARAIAALVSLSKDKNFNWITMMKKATRQVDRFHKCITQEGYEQMFRDMYNNRNSNPIA